MSYPNDLHDVFRDSLIYTLASLLDRFGRIKIILISALGMIATGVIASFSVNIEMLIIMRLLLGVFTAGIRNASFVYGMYIFVGNTYMVCTCV